MKRSRLLELILQKQIDIVEIKLANKAEALQPKLPTTRAEAELAVLCAALKGAKRDTVRTR